MPASSSSMKAHPTLECAQTRQGRTRIASSGKLCSSYNRTRAWANGKRMGRRYDELHPSVQAERVVAKEISDVIHRRSEKWITWLS